MGGAGWRRSRGLATLPPTTEPARLHSIPDGDDQSLRSSLAPAGETDSARATIGQQRAVEEVFPLAVGRAASFVVPFFADREAAKGGVAMVEPVRAPAPMPPRRAPFYALLAAQAISYAGNALAALALPWFVLTTTGSAARVGLVAFCALLPQPLAATFGGAFVDRLGHRRASVVADLASGIAVAPGAAPPRTRPAELRAAPRPRLRRRAPRRAGRDRARRPLPGDDRAGAAPPGARQHRARGRGERRGASPGRSWRAC